MGSQLKIIRIEWDEDNIEHAEGHGIPYGEAHEVLTNAEPRVFKPNRRPVSERRYFCYGSSDAGRLITVVFAYYPATNTARPITAWNMTDTERRIHEREAK